MSKQYNTEGLRQYQKKLNSETQEKVLKALSKTVRSGAKITVKEVAEKAGVAIMTIYNNPNLRERIYQAKEIQDGQDIPKAIKEEQTARIKELQGIIARLRKELSDEKSNSALMLGHLEKATSKNLELEARLKQYRTVVDFRKD